MAATSRSVQLALALAVAVCLLPLGVAHATVAHAPLVTTGASGCTDPLPSAHVSGTLSVQGGPLASGNAGVVTLQLRYWVPWVTVDFSNNTQTGSGCQTETVRATTSYDGTLAATLTSPARSCATVGGDEDCTSFGLPHGPVTVAPDGGPPSGYAWSAATNGSPANFDLAFVWELAYLTVSPSNATTVVSTDAPVTVSATGYMQNGSVTPLSPTFRWTLAGSGWSFLGAAEGPSVELTGYPGASLATVGVSATAQVNETVLAPPALAIHLLAVPTAISRATLDRTAVDAGTTIAVVVDGTGADGYAYSASFDPGLGLATLPLPCTSQPGPGETVVLGCSGTYSYPVLGTAQPTAMLSNGFASDGWTFPAVTVTSSPVLSLVAGTPAGYPDVPVPLEVAAANATGVAPYTGACLDSGAGGPACLDTPGPSWAFAPIYPEPGEYNATAWTTDAAGVNASVGFQVSIVPALALGPLQLGTPNLTAGIPATVSVAVSGGDLPARVWWNVSGVATPWASAVVLAGGSLSTTLLPSAAGVLEVSVAVADALGSVERAAALYSVAPAPAANVEAWSAPPARPVVVGTGASFAWAALDREGNPVRAFTADAELFLTGGNGAADAWVNASGAGPLSTLGNGTYLVPPSAWVDGILNLTVVPARAGTFTVTLAGTELPNPVAPQAFTAAANVRDVRLVAPEVALEGLRVNSTFWLVQDRFGDAAPGAVLSVSSLFGSASSSVLVVAQSLPNGSSGVWINFSAPTDAAGSIEVVDQAGVAVLGPLDVPAVPSSPPPAPVFLVAATVGPAGAIAVGVSAIVRHRRLHRPPSPPPEQELVVLAEGRERVVEILRERGPCDLEQLESAWSPSPAPPELADWLASLVADGTLGATIGPDRVARFCLASGSSLPRVEIDTALLEEALRRRDAERNPG